MQSRGWTFSWGQHVWECCSLVAYIPRWRGEAWQWVLVYCIWILANLSDEASMKAQVCSTRSLFKLWCHMIKFLTFEFHWHSFTSPTMTTWSPPLLLSFLLVVSRIPGGSHSCMANSNNHNCSSRSLRRGRNKTTLTKPCGIDLRYVCICATLKVLDPFLIVCFTLLAGCAIWTARGEWSLVVEHLVSSSI